MARQITASCRLCRRENEKLFLKGTKCISDKCAFVRRRRGKLSDYAIQLREKQKAKRIYGILEQQFKNYFKKAERDKGATGEVLLQLLERRLDNVIYRACFAGSRSAARQLVGHRFVKVNGRKVNLPSYLVKGGDEVLVTGTDEQVKALKENTKILQDRGIPEWIEVSAENLAVKIKKLPKKSDIGMVIEESLIVELYSK